MNLQKLFEAQKELDERIIKEKGLEGQDLLPNKILALQVELGECANEWQGFKYWSKYREPRIEWFIKCKICRGFGHISRYTEDEIKQLKKGKILRHSDMTYKPERCALCNGTGEILFKNPLLEEYVDCLHFVLSIGLGDSSLCVYDHNYEPKKRNSIIDQFHDIYCQAWLLRESYVDGDYEDMLRKLLGLGEMLGFSWEQVEQAYFEKNKVNHKRQDRGY